MHYPFSHPCILQTLVAPFENISNIDCVLNKYLYNMPTRNDPWPSELLHTVSYHHMCHSPVAGRSPPAHETPPRRWNYSPLREPPLPEAASWYLPKAHRMTSNKLLEEECFCVTVLLQLCTYIYFIFVICFCYFCDNEIFLAKCYTFKCLLGIDFITYPCSTILAMKTLSKFYQKIIKNEKNCKVELGVMHWSLNEMKKKKKWNMDLWIVQYMWPSTTKSVIMVKFEIHSNKLPICVWFVRIGQYLTDTTIWKSGIGGCKIAFKVVKIKFLAMQITDKKCICDIFTVGNLLNSFMEHLYLMPSWYLT